MYNIILIIFLLISCSKDIDKPYDKSYPFTGTIIKKFDENNQMLIDHEEVPGFMDKMVMMFNIDSTINIPITALARTRERLDEVVLSRTFDKLLGLPSYIQANDPDATVD